MTKVIDEHGDPDIPGDPRATGDGFAYCKMEPRVASEGDCILYFEDKNSSSVINKKAEKLGARLFSFSGLSTVIRCINYDIFILLRLLNVFISQTIAFGLNFERG